jgi:hypothetical protein
VRFRLIQVLAVGVLLCASLMPAIPALAGAAALPVTGFCRGVGKSYAAPGAESSTRMEVGYISCTSAYVTCSFTNGTDWGVCDPGGWTSGSFHIYWHPTDVTAVASTHNICDSASNCSGWVGTNSWTP